MSTHRLTRWQKAGALIPMALLVGAWGAAMNNSVLANSGESDAPAIPDVPSTALEQPATVESQTPAGIDPRAGAEGTLSKLATNGIPAAAVAGYKRAESLLEQAVPSCNLSWTVLAGIGRVESNHGRSHGNSLTDEGTATPGIYGVQLDGTGGIAKILDTDGGKLDNDSVYDRAVGPMQFLPQTWQLVAVDANNDGEKDPQNISDAATAAAIYLCSGGADLGSDDGAREAVHRYNHSDSYVDLVLSIAAKYANGEFTKTPNGQTEAMALTADSMNQSPGPAQRKKAAAKKKAKEDTAQNADSGSSQDSGRQGGTGQTHPPRGAEGGADGGSGKSAAPKKKPSSVSRGLQNGVEKVGGKTLGKATKPVTDTTEFVECKVVRNVLGLLIPGTKC